MTNFSALLLCSVSILALAATVPIMRESYSDLVQRPIQRAIAMAQSGEPFQPVRLPAELVNVQDIARAMLDPNIRLNPVPVTPAELDKIADRLRDEGVLNRREAIDAARRLLAMDQGLQIIHASAVAGPGDTIPPDPTEATAQPDGAQLQGFAWLRPVADLLVEHFVSEAVKAA